MGDLFEQVPSIVQDHIMAISKDFKKPGTEDSLKAIANAWLEKKEVFERKIADADMEEVDSFVIDDESAALVLTYSGSLISIGSLVDDVRNITYTSIGFRTEIPESAEKDNSNLKADLLIDNIAEFTNGPVKKTSKLFKIVVCKGDLSAEKQEETITGAVTMIEEEFVEVNKTILME